jgi:hypothetical protein
MTASSPNPPPPSPLPVHVSRIVGDTLVYVESRVADAQGRPTHGAALTYPQIRQFVRGRERSLRGAYFDEVGVFEGRTGLLHHDEAGLPVLVLHNDPLPTRWQAFWQRWRYWLRGPSWVTAPSP